MRLPAARGARGRRDTLALGAVASAAAIVGIAVPLLAARVARDEHGGLLPSLPVLLTISAISIAVALLALYRLSAGEAPPVHEEGEPGFPEPAPALGSSEGVGTEPNGSSASAAEPADGHGLGSVTRSKRTTVGGHQAPGPEDLAALVRAEAERLVRELRAEPRRATEERPHEETATRPASPAPSTPRSRPPRPTRSTRPPSAEARPTERGSPASTEPQDEEKSEAAVAETCEVVWWHGARKGGFEARLEGSRARPVVVARSRPITWSGEEPPPPETLAADAHRMLVEKLLGQGWEPASQGHNWYSSRFQRGRQ